MRAVAITAILQHRGTDRPTADCKKRYVHVTSRHVGSFSFLRRKQWQLLWLQKQK